MILFDLSQQLDTHVDGYRIWDSIMRWRLLSFLELNTGGLDRTPREYGHYYSP